MIASRGRLTRPSNSEAGRNTRPFRNHDPDRHFRSPPALGGTPCTLLTSASSASRSSPVSIGNGAKARVEAQIANLGQNVLLIMSGNVSRGGFRPGFGAPGTLKIEDYDAIRKEVDGVAGISPEVRANAQVAAGNQNHNPSITGVGADYVNIRSWDIISGENFTETDVRNASKVALIGKTAGETLFGEGAQPVGEIVRIRTPRSPSSAVLSPKA
jgi:putative ABC transport system permease protein